MKRNVLMVLLLVMLLCVWAVWAPPPAAASVASNFVQDATGSVKGISLQVLDAALFGLGTVAAPDAMGLVSVLGDKQSNVLAGTQLKFGSYQGSPFLFNAGLLIQEPAKGRVAVGLGTALGGFSRARVSLYIELVPDDLSTYTLGAAGLQNWAAALGIGASWPF